MIEKDNIDSYFRERLGKPEQKYSAQHWAAMESMLNNDGIAASSSQTLFWRRMSFLLLGLLIISIGTIGLLHFKNQPVMEGNVGVVSNTQDSSLAEKQLESTNGNKPLNGLAAISTETMSEQQNRNQSINTRDVSLNEVNENRNSNAPDLQPEYMAPLPMPGDTMSSEEMPLTTANESTDLDFISIALRGKAFPGFIYNKKVDMQEEQSPLRLPVKPKFYLGFQTKLYAYQKTKPEATNMNLGEVEVPKKSIGHELYVGLTKNRWNFQIGFGMSELRENTNYKYDQNNYSFDTSYQLIRMDHSLSEDGRPLALIYERIDTTTTTVQQNVCQNCETKFKFVDIPVAVKYEMGNGRLRPFVQATEIVSIAYQASGYYTAAETSVPDANGINYAIEEIAVSNLTKVNLQTELKLGVALSLTSRVQAHAGVAGRMYHGSIMRNYNQKPQINSMQIGFDYTF